MKKKDNDKIKKSVQTSSACELTGSSDFNVKSLLPVNWQQTLPKENSQSMANLA